MFVFFLFLWAKCKRQFSVPFLSCSCSRVDHVCVFLFEQINDDDDDDDYDAGIVCASRATAASTKLPCVGTVGPTNVGAILLMETDGDASWMQHGTGGCPLPTRLPEGRPAAAAAPP